MKMSRSWGTPASASMGLLQPTMAGERPDVDADGTEPVLHPRPTSTIAAS
jgi:hypothetical protein